MINYIIGALIFGYAAWTILKYVKRSKQGKCAACDLKKSCETTCDVSIDPNKMHK
ncbi:FeoB-associated Cys-rich membrane protein [Bacillaceae bacterium SAS-127]|nr:FeoB-associated Cys-rich membrane protein [Bacillaceae bacterium SAS-127]